MLHLNVNVCSLFIYWTWSKMFSLQCKTWKINQHSSWDKNIYPFSRISWFITVIVMSVWVKQSKVFFQNPQRCAPHPASSASEERLLGGWIIDAFSFHLLHRDGHYINFLFPLHPQTLLDCFDFLFTFCPESHDTQPAFLSGSIADRRPYGD